MLNIKNESRLRIENKNIVIFCLERHFVMRAPLPNLITNLFICDELNNQIKSDLFDPNFDSLFLEFANEYQKEK